MWLLHPESRWPDSHVVQKFLDGLGSEFDLWLTTWEPNNSPINKVSSDGSVIKKAVTLKAATDAAIKFDTAQKQRDRSSSLLSRTMLLSQTASRYNAKGIKRRRCCHCSGNYPNDNCYVAHPEKKPPG